MQADTVTRRTSENEFVTYTDLSPKNFSAICRTKLTALKNSLVEKFTEEFGELPADLVRHAVDEADALASLTWLPHLLLPTLAEEKVHGLRQWQAHQQAVLFQPLFAQAA